MLKGYEFTEDGAESVQRVMEQMSKSEDLFDTLYSQDENFHKSQMATMIKEEGKIDNCSHVVAFYRLYDYA